jgi:hypothetical protein
MHASNDFPIKLVSEIPEVELTAIELQLQRALVAELMQRIAVLEHRLQQAELKQNRIKAEDVIVRHGASDRTA